MRRQLSPVKCHRASILPLNLRVPATFYVVSTHSAPFIIGRKLRLGPKVVVTMLERDPRWMMITAGKSVGADRPNS